MMKQQHSWTLSAVVLMAFLLASVGFGGLPQKDNAKRLQKTLTDDTYRPFLINNIFNYYSNNGDGSYNKFSSNNEGFEFTKGTGKTVIFEDGVVWGGYHKGRLVPKVGGSVYRHGLEAGPLLTYGTATTDPTPADPTSTQYRIYRVRPDINPKTPLDDAMTAKIQSSELQYIVRYESYSVSDIYNQYIKDWNEWPAADGAPFTYGKDANGVQRTAPAAYDPNFDVPGVPQADQTLWYVSNDESTSRATGLAGSPPIGLEMQRTIWGYNRQGPLGYMIFASSLIINKSGAKIDTMYMVQWSDPDLGDAGDDFVGCDTARKLGYVYNGKSTDQIFGTAVPAGGFVFFQGPIVPGAATDTAVFRLQYKPGFKNLKMSAFVLFINSQTSIYQDPDQGQGGDVQWYRLMKGTIAFNGGPFIDPNTNQPSTFVCPGDPVTGTGWVDGPPISGPADRRLCMVTGPFTMAPGDTQELVVANLAGLGADYLSSITVLRSYTDQAQQAYNSLFQLPQAPPAPTVVAAELDGQIVLNWGDPANVSNEKTYESKGYTFEGYNVYQLPTSTFNSSTAKKIATYDLVDGIQVIRDTVTLSDPAFNTYNQIELVQTGSDNGISRSFVFNKDFLTGKALIDGTRYYYAISSYAYNPNPPATSPSHTLESATALTVVPQSPAPGTRYTANPGDTTQNVRLAVKPGVLPSEGSVVPIVVDPRKLTGHNYSVSFVTDTLGVTTWNLTDVSAGKVLAANQENQTGTEDYPIVDGLKVKVIGPPPGMKSWSIPSGLRKFSPVGGNGLGLEGFSNAGDEEAPQDQVNGSIGMGFNFPFANTTLLPAQYHNVLLKLAHVDSAALWDPRTTPADTNFSLSYRYLRGAGAAAADSTFAPWIVNTGAGYAYQDYIHGVPLAAWDMETNPPRRLAIGHLENNVAGGLVDGRWWPALTDVSNVDAGGPREWLFIFDAPYTTTPDPQFEVNFSGATVPLMWVLSCARRADVSWQDGDQFEIFAYHVNAPADTFYFSTKAPTVADRLLAIADVGRVNVYPNPYFGYNPQEPDKYTHFVTFTHLPPKATIRIFNLAGVLVRTLRKDNTSQFQTWDLKNESNFPAAAGMYIVHIDMPDLGTTKTLKLGIIPQIQYLDRY